MKVEEEYRDKEGIIDGGKDMREIIRGVGVVKLGVLDYYLI